VRLTLLLPRALFSPGVVRLFCSAYIPVSFTSCVTLCFLLSLFLSQVQLSAVQNSAQFHDSSEGKVSNVLPSSVRVPVAIPPLPYPNQCFDTECLKNFSTRQHYAFTLLTSLCLLLKSSRLRAQVQERSMAADSERAYEAFVSHQMGGGAPPK
jgi:hypothetical protein